MKEFFYLFLEAIKNYLPLKILDIIFLIYSSSSLASYTFQKLKIHKSFKAKDVRIILPEPLKKKYSSIEMKQISSDKIKEDVLKFSHVLEENFPSDSLINFYNNINEAKIHEVRSLGRFPVGNFNDETLEIKLVNPESIFHELFHLASNNNGFCGFNSQGKGDGVGVGINEGYTSLLDHRYFGNNYISKEYEFCYKVTELLEKTIGKEKMENLYLKSDLIGLIKELKEYTSEQEIANFISKVDLIFNFYFSAKLPIGSKTVLFINQLNEIKKSLKIVARFLYKIYMKKLDKQLKNGEIKSEDFIKEYNEFFELFKNCFDERLHNYNFITSNNLSKRLETQFKFYKLVSERPSSKDGKSIITIEENRTFTI